MSHMRAFRAWRWVRGGCLTLLVALPSTAATAAGLVTAQLQPQPLLGLFEQLSAVPRVSKHEKQVLDWLKEFAEQHSLTWAEDSYGNLAVKRGGINGGEGAPPVVVQAHVDMVTEKNRGIAHDFFTDGLDLRLINEEGRDWLTATGTTLGADNGIGVAAALAVLSLDERSGARLPPIEALFTVDEETGLNGAYNLDASLVSGSTMLNLDTEEWGALYVGCAGGGTTNIALEAPTQVLDGRVAETLNPYMLQIKGLMGGHSGINIHEDRANAVVLLSKVLGQLAEDVGCRLVEVEGGDKHNAIPREASAVLLLTAQQFAKAEASIAEWRKSFESEYGTRESGLLLQLAPTEGDASECLADEAATSLIRLLTMLPHGVLKRSHIMDNLVETSTNVASVKFVDAAGDVCGRVCKIQCSTRSSLPHAVASVRRSIKAMATLCGGTVTFDTAYPGWIPDLSSPLLELAKQAAREILQREPEILAIHAGLECGVLKERLGGSLDVVSFGPTIHGNLTISLPHCPASTTLTSQGYLALDQDAAACMSCTQSTQSGHS
ncbi:unnamed protein product [Chrysoparadoxa australica]